MAKNSKFDFLRTLKTLESEGKISFKLAKILKGFYQSYLETVDPIRDQLDHLEETFVTFLNLVSEQEKHPYLFEHFHKKVRKPFDYYAFGLNLLRPLIIKEKSSISGKKHLEEIVHHLDAGNNVVFFANHQIEADPILISLLLEEEFPKLAEEMIFVAGERVITDPLAIPFSLGCNLLCIYSKRYMDHPPELKHHKQMHNKKTMQIMSSLLSEGGKCIYVAPSGGRDRRGPNGQIQIAPFDPKSIEMFYFMAKRSKTPTYFYPMALGTYDLLPPPETIQVELGEKRSTKRVGIHLSVGPSIDMHRFPEAENPDKEVRRKSRSDYIWNLVKKDYLKFPKESS